MRASLRFVGSAAVSSAVALLGASILIFGAIHFVPGGYADAVLPQTVTPEAKTAFTHQLGLDKPLPLQYLSWLKLLAHGNLGTSLTSNQPVANEIGSRLPATAELTLIATLFSVLVGVPLGAIAALRSRGRVTPTFTRATSSLALAVPNFVLGTAIAYMASVHFLGLSIPLYVPFSADAVANLRAVLLPGLVLGVFPAGLIARTARDATLGVLTEPFITAAVARGETPFQIFRRHVLRNSSLPVITLVAVNVGYLLGGAVIIENIFSIPGIGQYALSAVQSRDYPQVEGVVILGTLAFVVLNLMADFMYAIVDPRVSLSGRRA